MICSVCGTRNPADAAFCSQCGTALQADAVTGQTVRIPAADAQEAEAGARVYQTPPSAPVYNQPYSVSTGPQQSQTAVVALVLGVVSILLLVLPGSSLFTAIPAVIVGRNARNEIRASGGQLTGEGMAQTGIILGWITLGLLVLGFLAFCALFALPFFFLQYAG
jgi:hypothetical protein